MTSIIEVAPPKVGHYGPAFVRAEIILDTDNLADNVRLEWESLRQDDVIYLCTVQPLHDSHRLLNEYPSLSGSRDSQLLCLRTAEVVQLLDDHGRSLRENLQGQVNGYAARQRLRRMIVNLDGAEYKRDTERKADGNPDAYESMNLVIRRRGRENNFSKVLSTIKSLIVSDIPVPTWLQEVLLGYGDPASATYSRLASRLKIVDFRDTFLDWQHLVESLPGKASTRTSLFCCIPLTVLVDHATRARFKRRVWAAICARNGESSSQGRAKVF